MERIERMDSYLDNAKSKRLESLLENVLWTHKSLEKQEEIYSSRAKKLKTGSITCVALTSTGVLTIVLSSFAWSTIVTAVFATVSLGITIWREAADYEQKAAACTSAAREFLSLRDRVNASALKFLGEGCALSYGEIDVLEEQYSALCKISPRTTERALGLTEKGLAEGDSRAVQETLASLRALRD